MGSGQVRVSVGVGWPIGQGVKGPRGPAWWAAWSASWAVWPGRALFLLSVFCFYFSFLFILYLFFYLFSFTVLFYFFNSYSFIIS